MGKPMYCPMSFGNSTLSQSFIDAKGDIVKVEYFPMECTPDCAQAAIDNQNGFYACGMIDKNLFEAATNWRPLKDDTND